MARLHVPVPLRWSDLDAYGHVNNARLLTLLEEARIRVFWGDGDLAVDGAADSAGGDPRSGTVTLIARQEIEYLAPIPYLPDPLDVQLWIGRLGGASLDVCYEIRMPGEAAPVAARAATTIVLVDAASGRPRRISDRERAAWSAVLEDPVEFSRRG